MEHGKKLKFADFVTHQFRLDDIQDGIGTVARNESVKAVIFPYLYQQLLVR